MAGLSEHGASCNEGGGCWTLKGEESEAGARDDGLVRWYISVREDIVEWEVAEDDSETDLDDSFDEHPKYGSNGLL